MRSFPERPTTHDYDSCISLGSDHISLDCGLHRSGVPSSPADQVDPAVSRYISVHAARILAFAHCFLLTLHHIDISTMSAPITPQRGSRLAVPPSDSASAASAILVITEAGLAEIAAALPVQVNPFLVTAGVRAEGGLRLERPLSQRPIAPAPAHPAHGVTVLGARNTAASCSGRVGLPASSSTSHSVFSPGATPTPHNANDRRAELSRKPIAPRQSAFSPPPPPQPIKRRVPPKEVNSEVSVEEPKRVKVCQTSRETLKLCTSAC